MPVLLATVASAVSADPSLTAARLTFRHYTVADGLAHDLVRDVYQDRRGSMWFATGEGLSRFDGYRLTSFGISDGLGHPMINAVGEDPAGRLWVGTNGGGVARLSEGEDRGGRQRPFIAYDVGAGPANEVNSFVFDAAGAIWCATDAGLFRARAAGDARPQFARVVPYGGPPVEMPALRARSGELWFALYRRIVRIDLDGTVATVDTPPDLAASGQIVALGEDAGGRILVASHDAIVRLDGTTWTRIPIALRARESILTLAVDAAGTLWVGTSRGLIARPSAGSAVVMDGITTAVLAITSDVDGRLWIGTATTGVYSGLQTAVVRFTADDGLPDPFIWRLFGDDDGTVFALSYSNVLVRIRGDRVTPLPLALPPLTSLLHRDRSHRWWFGTPRGIWRTSGDVPALSQASLVLPIDPDPRLADIPPSIYEAPDGRFWIGVLGSRLYLLGSDGMPAGAAIHLDETPKLDAPGRLLLDRGGRLWLSSYGGLGWFQGGRAHAILASDGLPETLGRALFLDSRGWLWIGLRYGGVSVSKNPDAQNVQFRNYSVADGLGSATVVAITEDAEGRMYFATGRGLDRLDVTTGRIRHFTPADGLIEGHSLDCWRDPAGRIWIASATGISRFDPRLEAPRHGRLPVYVTRVEIAGETVPMSPRGVRTYDAGALSSSRNSLAIDFTCVALSDARSVLYQFRLDGADARWSAPTDQRSIRYAGLAPGGYVFRVRAVDPDMSAAAEPATLAFTILRPVWQRPWFVGLALAIVAATAAAVYRARVRRIVAMERVRSQVAIDLHDELGSGLVQIAVLSEVAKRGDASGSHAILDQVAGLARALRESMSDIVWAVDPRKDSFVDVVQRMRQTAYNLLDADGLRLEFHAPEDRAVAGIDWPADRRRQVLLLFKEAVTNIARHASASCVTIDIRVERREIRVRITDDGRGFSLAGSPAGHGLASMRQRAEALGGGMVLWSQPGAGTIVELTAPLA